MVEKSVRLSLSVAACDQHIFQKLTVPDSDRGNKPSVRIVESPRGVEDKTTTFEVEMAHTRYDERGCWTYPAEYLDRAVLQAKAYRECDWWGFDSSSASRRLLAIEELIDEACSRFRLQLFRLVRPPGGEKSVGLYAPFWHMR